MNNGNRYLEPFPFLHWLKEVNGQSLKADLVAGITGAVIVLPQGVAFAMIAGLPPIYGLYTAMVTPIIAALFGSSRHLISGPTTAISIVVYSSISPFAQAGTAEFIQLTLIMTLVAGIIQLALGLASMGTLVNFVSHSVVVGFTTGAALLIAGSQLKHMLGLTITPGGNILEKAQNLFAALPEFNINAFVIALLTMLVALVARKVSKKLPHLLIAMVAGGALYAFAFPAKDINVVGQLPSQLPPFEVPKLSFDLLRQLTPNAFAIALLGLIEAVAIARSISNQSGQRINGNQEFVGQGLSNIVGSMFSSYAGTGSFTRSGINYESGAKTPLAAIFAAVLLMIIVVLISPLTAYLPIPAMAGIIVVVAYNLIDVKQIRKILSASKAETAVLTITFIATLTLDLQFAIYFGVFFSLTFYLQKTSRPRLVSLAPDPETVKHSFVNAKRFKMPQCPQLKVIRIEGSLFFGAIDHVQAKMEIVHKGEENHLLIVGSSINVIDVAGAELLVAEAKKWKSRGGAMYITGLKKRAREFLVRGGYHKEIGETNFFVTKEEAISAVYQKLNQDICADCSVRIFWECSKTG